MDRWNLAYCIIILVGDIFVTLDFMAIFFDDYLF